MTEDTKLFVLQPTSFCNLNCNYCYVPERRNTARMDYDVLEKAIRCLFADKISGSRGEVEFLYHAGEPMTVGRAFYENALLIIDKYKPSDVKVTNVMQTNGVLINEEWAKFFAEHEFKVGVSLDGPEFLHNLNRKNWSGIGSFDKALRGFKLLRKHGVGTGILSVITSKHLEHPEELIKFYVDNQMTDVAFNIEEIENDNKTSSLGDIKDVKSDKYYSFMNKVFDLILMHGDCIRIREVSDIIYMLFSKQKNPKYITEPLETRDLGIVTVQRNGDISTYCPEFAGIKSEKYNNFVIGNVLKIDRLSDVKNDVFYKKIKRDYDRRKSLCRASCKYYSLCGSSFISNSYSESGSLLTTENIGCILHKQKLTDLVLNKLMELSN